MRAHGAVLAMAMAMLVGATSIAQAEGRSGIDAVAYRFAAPELGGWAKPRFITQRMLAFEARLEALAEQLPLDAGYAARHVRAALDRHVAEEVLASLPTTPPLAAADVERLASSFAPTLPQEAADREGIALSEVHALAVRQARAALYVDRALSPILHATEEQLREVYRSSSHPYRGRPFEEVRGPLELWFIGERLRVAESTFYQSARTRIKVVGAPAR